MEAEPGPAAHPLPAAAVLEERERIVLEELARELDAHVSFQGLRRQLGVHQQALARTLRRLRAQGLVASDGKGYQLTDRGSAALRALPAAPARPTVPLVQALLPPHVAAGDVAALLARRWFGGLRWYGQSEAPGETSLHWLAGASKVTVRVSGGAVTLEVDDAADAERFAAARPILVALAELYGVGSGAS